MSQENIIFRKVLGKSRQADLLQKVKKLDTRVRQPLKGQLEIAKELREKGFTFTEIASWLAENGIAVHPATICRTLKGGRR
jgi:hypothetical protein